MPYRVEIEPTWRHEEKPLVRYDCTDFAIIPKDIGCQRVLESYALTPDELNYTAEMLAEQFTNGMKEVILSELLEYRKRAFSK